MFIKKRGDAIEAFDCSVVDVVLRRLDVDDVIALLDAVHFTATSCIREVSCTFLRKQAVSQKCVLLIHIRVGSESNTDGKGKVDGVCHSEVNVERIIFLTKVEKFSLFYTNLR